MQFVIIVLMKLALPVTNIMDFVRIVLQVMDIIQVLENALHAQIIPIQQAVQKQNVIIALVLIFLALPVTVKMDIV